MTAGPFTGVILGGYFCAEEILREWRIMRSSFVVIIYHFHQFLGYFLHDHVMEVFP